MQKRDLSEEVMGLMESPLFEEHTFLNFLEKRKIIINKEISDDIVERAILQIIKINEEDRDIPVDKRKPIQIYLNTPGGHVDIGLILCSVIQQSKTPIHIITLAYAASMGALILMCGHKRYAYPFSNILIHDGSMFIGGSTSKVKDHMKFQEEKEAQIKKLIMDKTEITVEKYDEKYQSEWWMSANTAKEFGIIDGIVGEDYFLF